MKASTRWVMTGLACVVILLALAAYKFLQIQAMIAYGKSFPEPSESVAAATATTQAFQQTVSTIGEIIAPQSLQLRNEEEGVIAELNFAPGDRVEKGRVLVQLDVSEEKARLKAAQARVNLAQLDLERIQRLRKQKTVSQEAMDQARADYDIARADVMALEAIINRKTLRAPFDAIAGLHHLDVGEYLQANTAIVSLVGVTDYTWVDFNLPLAQASLTVGSEVSVELPDQQRRTFSARVIARDPLASEGARTIGFRARIEQGGQIPSNTLVRVTVPMATAQQLAIPRTALLVDGMGDHVFVLVPDESGKGYRAHRRQVKVGYKDEQDVGVIDGLQDGELVASKGAFKLAPNMLTFVRERPTIASQDEE